MESAPAVVHREPWNKGKIVGQKAPFKPKDIWALRVRLQMENRVRELAHFNLGTDSKLRGCDLVALKVRDVCHGDQVASRATVMQHKTHHPVQFELTATTREALQQWIKTAKLKSEDFIFRAGFTSRRISGRISTREFTSAGLYCLAWIQQSTERTPCGVPKPRSSIAEPKTYVRSSYCWSTQKSSQLFAILALRSTTLWSFQSKQKSEIAYLYLSRAVITQHGPLDQARPLIVQPVWPHTTLDQQF